MPLLGINGSAIISHGRSNAKAIKNALRVARQTAESDVAGTIARGLAKLGAGASAESVYGRLYQLYQLEYQLYPVVSVVSVVPRVAQRDALLK